MRAQERTAAEATAPRPYRLFRPLSGFTHQPSHGLHCRYLAPRPPNPRSGHAFTKPISLTFGAPAAAATVFSLSGRVMSFYFMRVLLPLCVCTLHAAVVMPAEHAAAFTEGLAGLLARWTAFQLAITNEWGGADSVAKGAATVEELTDWFLKRKGREVTSLLPLLSSLLFCSLLSIQAPGVPLTTSSVIPLQLRGALMARRCFQYTSEMLLSLL